MVVSVCERRRQCYAGEPGKGCKWNIGLAKAAGISLQTLRQVESELAVPVDKRRFRANMYVSLTSDRGFAEDEFVGRTLRIGDRAKIVILERDPRCRMISLDPMYAVFRLS